MAALTKIRDTQAKRGLNKTFKMAAVKIFAGSIVCIEAGYAKPGESDTDLLTVGIACETVDNSAGSPGDKSIVVSISGGDREFLVANDAAPNAVTQADIGTDVYLLDDQTVTTDSTDRSVAGKAMGLDSGQVWIRFPV